MMSLSPSRPRFLSEIWALLSPAVLMLAKAFNAGNDWVLGLGIVRQSSGEAHWNSMNPFVVLAFCRGSRSHGASMHGTFALGTSFNRKNRICLREVRSTCMAVSPTPWEIPEFHMVTSRNQVPSWLSYQIRNHELNEAGLR